MVLPVSQDRGRVDEHRLPVAELDDGDLQVRRPELGVPDRLEVRRGDQAGAAFVDGIDDRAVRAALAVAVRAIRPAVVQPEVRRDRDQAEAVGDHLVEEGAHALVFLAVLRADRPQVELDVLDRHLRDVRHEDPSQGVRVRRLRLLDQQPHRLRRRR